MTNPGSVEHFRPERLLAFSDGVFGVAITLLVIDLRLPPLASEGDEALLNALWAIRPNLFVFAFTFIVLGTSWLGHHRKFSYIGRVDGRLLWLNLVYLMAVCLVPFASSVLGEHNTNRFAFVLYATVLALVDMLSACLSAYGLRHPFIEGHEKLRPGLRLDMALAPLLVGVIFLTAAALALSGLTRFAHWILLLVVPALALSGIRTRWRSSSLQPTPRSREP